jgi:perosamine synthetase
MAKLALHGGDPVRKDPYAPYNTIGEAEKARALEVLDSGVLSGYVARGNHQFGGGPAVTELEDAFRSQFGVRHAVAFNSATSALHGCLVAIGIGPGDEVIVPPYTMSATAMAVMMCGAVPVFADIEPDMFCIDPDRIISAITERTRAVIAVNLFGLPADLVRIGQIAEEHGIILVEDNAQAPLATCSGQLAGTIGSLGVFSLNRHKVIQCGEGGVALTDDDEYAERLQLCRNHGEVIPPDWGRDEPADIVGYNYRLPDLLAAVAIPQVGRLSQLRDARVKLADLLTSALADVEVLAPPRIRNDCTHSYYLYPMLYNRDVLGISRDVFLDALQAEGVHAARYVTPIHLLPIFQKHQRPSDPGFDRLFPGYDGECSYGRGQCPTVERVRDFFDQERNFLRFYRESVLAGELPYWNERVFSGISQEDSMV